MGIIDFFSKKNGGGGRKHFSRHPLSSSNQESASDSDSDSDSSIIKANRAHHQDDRSTTRRQKPKKRHAKDIKHLTSRTKPPVIDSESDEALTKEELFGLPAKQLRFKCRRLGLDSRHAVEKEELVHVLHCYYKKKASRGGIQDDGGEGGSTAYTISPSIPNNKSNPPTSVNDRSLVSTVQEIIPYFGKGDVNIDEIVVDTIERMFPAALEARDQSGNTLLLLACMCNAQDLVPILLAKGSDPNATNTFGETALHFSVYTDSYSPESAKVLVQYGANPEISEKRFGCTALHYAASIGDAELCRTLLDGGALPTTMDFNGCDPILYATQSNMHPCIQLLKTASQWTQCESKIDASHDRGYDSDWEQLVDHQTGMPYYHCRTTGKSLWADEYNFYRDTKTHQSRSNSLAVVERKRETSFRKAPPSVDEDVKNAPSETSMVADSKAAYLTPLKPDAKNAFCESKDSVNVQSSWKRSVSSRPSRRETITRNKRQSGIDGGDISLVLRDDLQNMLSDSSGSSELSSSGDNQMGNIANGTRKKIKESERTGVKQVPDEIVLSPTVNSKKLVSQESFNQRLESMQEQFLEALKKQQNAESSNKNGSGDDQEQSQQMHKGGQSHRKHFEVREIDEIAEAKDVEIQKLSSKIKKLEIDLDSAPNVPEVFFSDAIIGNADVRDVMWIASQDFETLKEDTQNKSTALSELQVQCVELQASLGANERKLVSMEEMQIRSTEQMLLMEDLLRQEMDAKNEAVILMEQARAGIAGDVDIAKSLQEDTQRSDDMVVKLRSDFKDLEHRCIQEKTDHVIQMEALQKKVLEQSMELASLQTQLESSLSSCESVKQSLQRRHQTQIEELVVQHNERQGNVKDQIYTELKAKRQAEFERDNAIETRDEAIRNVRNAERHLDQMKVMIRDAKELLASNEKLHKSLHIETEKRKSLHNKLEDLKGKIRVYVRIRPLNKGETEKNCKETLVKEDKMTCVVHRTDAAPKSWEFDQVFGGRTSSSQEDVFKDTKALITSAIDGFNVCIFCYGQTGSGKTFTMISPSGEIPLLDNVHEMDDNVGLAPRAIVEIFKVLGDRSASFDVSVSANMLELYNDSIRDLVARSKGGTGKSLRIKLAEHSGSGLVEVDGAENVEVNDAVGLLDLFRRGTQSRTTASTKMNADSSRSHLIMTVVTKLVNKRTGKCTNGKLTLVDLAGSERVAKSGASGNQLKEAQSINKSLSALGDVIHALTSGSKHIPYRNHPLTMLMSDSMGGNAKTLMIVCCSPADYNSSENTNSLDFAKRCKHVKNKIKAGQEAGDESQVKALKAELTRMKRERGGGLPVPRAKAQRPGVKY